MPIPLHVLMVEDNESDAALALAHLEKAGFGVICQRVDNAADLRSALQAQSWDLILCDYSLPSFDAPSALRIFQETGLDLPFIVVSGTISEESATALMRAGAADYLMKDRLARLGPLVRRELTAAALRRDSEERFRLFVERSNEVFYRQSLSTTHFDYVSPRSSVVLGYTPQEMLSWTLEEQKSKIHPDDRPALLNFRHDLIAADARGEDHLEREFRLLDPTGGYRWIRGNYALLRAPDGAPEAIIGSLRDISAQKKAQQDLQAEELYLRTILTTARDGFWILNPQGEILMANQSACDTLGYTLAELQNMTIKDLNARQDPAPDAGLMRRILTNGSETFETRQRRKDGSLIDVEISATYLPEGGGRIISFSRDITERKRTAESLRQSEEKYATAFRVSPDAIAITRLSDGMYLEINEGFHAMSGYSEEDLRGRTAIEISIWADPEDRARLTRMLRENGSVTNLEARFRKKDGSFLTGLMSARWIEINGQACLLSVTRDISERKAAEEALRESELKLSTIFNISRDAIGVWCDGRHVLANPAYVRAFGYASQDEVLGKTILDLIAPAARPQVQADLALRAGGGPAPHFYTTRGLRKNGSEFDLELTVSNYEIHEQCFTLVILRDITERKQAEHILRESEYFFKETQRVGFIGSYTCDFRQDRWESSEVLDQIFGIGPEYERSIHGWLDVTHPEDRERMAHYLQEVVIEQRKPFNMDYRIVRKSDSAVRWVHGRGETSFDAKGSILTLIGTIQDITEQKLAEQQLNDQLTELRRWHAMTLGRERRILELKAEVNQLLQNAGLAPRYPSAQEKPAGLET